MRWNLFLWCFPCISWHDISFNMNIPFCKDWEHGRLFSLQEQINHKVSFCLLDQFWQIEVLIEWIVTCEYVYKLAKCYGPSCPNVTQMDLVPLLLQFHCTLLIDLHMLSQSSQCWQTCEVEFLVTKLTLESINIHYFMYKSNYLFYLEPYLGLSKILYI